LFFFLNFTESSNLRCAAFSNRYVFHCDATARDDNNAEEEGEEKDEDTAAATAPP